MTGLVVTAGFVDLVARAQAAGARISTEAYPYGSGMTAIGAAFLAPERLGDRGLVPSSLTYAPTGERVASAARLRELRQADPGGLAIIELLSEDDAADRRLLMRSLTFPGAVVASDAMPLTWTGPGPNADPQAWPPAATAITHPRTAGTFSRAVRMLTRSDEPLSLADALSKCSLQPARLLEDRAPAMRRKGRLRAGADADVVIFDADTSQTRPPTQTARARRRASGMSWSTAPSWSAPARSCPTPGPGGRCAPSRDDRGRTSPRRHADQAFAYSNKSYFDDFLFHSTRFYVLILTWD